MDDDLSRQDEASGVGRAADHDHAEAEKAQHDEDQPFIYIFNQCKEIFHRFSLTLLIFQPINALDRSCDTYYIKLRISFIGILGGISFFHFYGRYGIVK